MDELLTKYGISLPFRDLLADDPFAVLMGTAIAADYLGIHMVGAARCHHLALRYPEVDRQLWIETGDTALLRKMVVTYKQDKAHPQYSMIVLRARPLPETPDGLFAFSPPENARRVELEPVGALIQPEVANGTTSNEILTMASVASPQITPPSPAETLPPMSPHYRDVTVNGAKYYVLNGEYYTWEAGLETHILVDNPYETADVVDVLPPNAQEIMIDGAVYHKCGDAYFDQVYDGSRVRYRKVRAK